MDEFFFKSLPLWLNNKFTYINQEGIANIFQIFLSIYMFLIINLQLFWNYFYLEFVPWNNG
jgi:hypothetical protein